MEPINAVDPTKAGNLAQQIVAILINEESNTRQRAIRAAMMLLGEAVPRVPENSGKSPNIDQDGDNHADLSSFFSREDDLTPADNAFLCAAYHFSQFGTVPFSITEIRTIAQNAGVVVPDRLDMTFKNASKKGKKLYQLAGKGLFKPTAAGSVVYGERWNARPGRKTMPLTVAIGDGATDVKA